jgi:hypothetical protein
MLKEQAFFSYKNFDRTYYPSKDMAKIVFARYQISVFSFIFGVLISLAWLKEHLAWFWNYQIRFL